MFGNLFVKPKNIQTLPEFARHMCRELGLTGVTEHESSNYPPDDQYFVATSLGVELTIASTDDHDLADYPFWMNVDTDGYWEEKEKRGDALEGLSDLLARKLTVLGYGVARCPDFHKIGADIWRYSIKAGTSGRGRGEIVVEVVKPPS